jgi:myo-inositol-1(or 4)-monophosphatase
MVPEPGEPFAAEREVAVAAARAAGALIRSGFADGYGVRAKGEDGDVVTDLDVRAERLVVERIRERFPHDRILAEEAGLIDGTAPRTWLVDPLDGTSNVAVGLPAYVVGIAVCVADDPVVGVVHEPVTDRTWTAVRGAGAHGPRGRITVRDRPPHRAGPMLGWTQGHGVGRDDPVVHALRSGLERASRRLFQLWAPLLTWAMLARGDLDGFVGYRAEGIDLPAGLLLAQEAGLEVRTLDGGAFRGTATGPDTARSFVAGQPRDMPYLLELVKALTRRRPARPSSPSARTPPAPRPSP